MIIFVYALLFTTLDFMFLSVLFKKWNDEYTRPRLAAETKKKSMKLFSVRRRVQSNEII